MVTDKSAQRRLIEGLERAAPVDRHRMRKCFEPRHGIRLARVGETTDLVICFECLEIHMYSEDGTRSVFLMTRSPAAVFNQALRDAGLPIAPGAEE